MRKRGVILVLVFAVLFLSYVYASQFSDSTQSNFNNGTHTNTTYNGSAVVLFNGNLTGTFTSRIFDAGTTAEWNNLSWEGEIPANYNLSMSSAIHENTNITQVFVKDNNFYDADMKDANKRFYLNFSENLWNNTILHLFVKKSKGINVGIYNFSDSSGTNPIGTFNVTSTTGEWKDVNLSTKATKSIWLGEGTGSGNDPKELFDYIYAEVIRSSEIKFQVRNCSSSNCAGASFIGSDGTESSFFTSNSSNLSLSGRYFQYKFFMSREDTFYMPEIGNVSVGYRITNTAPSIDIEIPLNNSKHIQNISIRLNFSVRDTDGNLGSCWYNIDNGNNISLGNCANTTLGVSQGNHTLRIYANDTSGDLGIDSVSFSVDSINPSLSIINPTNISYRTVQNTFNYSVSDANLQSCWYSIDNGITNATVNCGENISISSGEGSSTWILYANDSYGNLNSSTVTFFIDSINPSVNIISPNDGSAFGTNTSLSLNYTASDSNLGSCWYRIDSGNNVSLANCANSTFNTSEGSHNLTLYANDSLGLVNSSSVSFIVDSVRPTLSIVYPQNISYSRVLTEINYSVSDSNIASCWYSLDNGASNTSRTCGSNVTGLSSQQGTNKWIVYANDSFGNENSANITFFVDSINPSVNIVVPDDGSAFGSNTSLALNYSASDVNLGSCWYRIDSGSNITIPNCGNITFNTSEGSHIIFVYANDSVGNIGMDNASFSIDVGAPSININSPSAGKYLNSGSVVFNYTASDIDLKRCELWGNFTGSFAFNQSNSSTITSGIATTFSLNISDGSYLWAVRCEDASGKIGMTNNRTINVDTVLPSIIISDPTGTKSSRNNINLVFNVTDRNPSSCWYNIIRGSVVEISNTTVNCEGGNTNFNVTIDADFALTLYANDSAGNANYNTSSFTVSTSSSGGSGNGGGSSGGGSGGSSFGSVAPRQSNDSLINVEFSDLGDIIVYPSEVKTLQLSVKNVGKSFLNKCKLQGRGEYSSWIESSDMKNINMGEIVEYLFNLRVPSLITEDTNVEIELVCLEKAIQNNITLKIVPNNLLVFIRSIYLKDKDSLVINYTTNEISQNENVLFYVIDEDNNIVAQSENPIEFNGEETSSIIDISKAKTGLLKISAQKEDDTIIIEEFFAYDPSKVITGLALLDNKNNTRLYIIIIVATFSIIAFFLIRNIIRLRKVKNIHN